MNLPNITDYYIGYQIQIINGEINVLREIKTVYLMDF